MSKTDKSGKKLQVLWKVIILLVVMGFGMFLYVIETEVPTKQIAKVNANFIEDGEYPFELLGKYHTEITEEANKKAVYRLVLNMLKNKDEKQPIVVEIGVEDYTKLEITSDYIGLLVSDVTGCQQVVSGVNCSRHIKIGDKYYRVKDYKPSIQKNETYIEGDWLDKLYTPQK